uniref:Uncharacterized protein n=1 Tax=Avena sativa TaxID=4498 RepID=A0ACD5Z924_AVESA
MFPISFFAANITKMPKAAKGEKDVEPESRLKSRFSGSRLRDIVLGLKKPRKDLIRNRGWGVLLDIGAFSTPRGLLEWIISKIDPELGEFRNARNNTHIVFNKEMVVKALGIPHGTRPVVLTGEHEESPHRDFYRIQYKTAGMRSPIYHAEKLLANDDLDDETWFRTFYLVVIGTYFFPGTSSMLPLEYLGSLGDSNIVCEYDWADQIFRHTMSGIKCFQDRCRKADKIGNTNPMWAGGCLPWIAIVYMDHLDFPVSTLSTHRINYAAPRASNISDADFKFVFKHDKSRLTLSPHTYGARPFRAFNVTPYAFVDTNLGNQAFEAPPNLQQNKEVPITHSVQEASPQHGTHTFSSTEGLPEYLKTIQEKYTSLWREDVDRLTKLHDKHMSQFASEAKLCVLEAKFDPAGCQKEFMEAYNDHMLKSKDMLYFAVVDSEHWVLVSINLLHKQVNFLDSMINAKKNKVYEKAHNLVDNFITLASHVKAFPRTNFRHFATSNGANPHDHDIGAEQG